MKSNGIFSTLKSKISSLSPRSLRRTHASDGVINSSSSPYNSHVVSMALDDLTSSGIDFSDTASEGMGQEIAQVAKLW